MFDFIIVSVVPVALELAKEIVWAGLGAICAYGLGQVISWFQ
jgi:hypothetical protein